MTKYKKGDFVWVSLPVSPDVEVVGQIMDVDEKKFWPEEPIYTIYFFMKEHTDGCGIQISSIFFRPATQEEGVAAQILND